MTSKLTALNNWLNDQSWELGTDHAKQRFNKSVRLVLIDDPQYTITASDVEAYIIAQFTNHSDPSKVEGLAKVAAIQFGVIQAFCKDNKISL
ncbi:hypothetical protein L8O48_04590 [Enterobacter cloacae]|uniref:hypothetical protein n=1 Tax=Enterobacter cloacae TaxID=550 RepID=UPI0020047FE8|nr:hypothetical protein [Enterobacter cloacae]MCK7266345.1 hypothetical protein [Enterobacter cloacae]